MKRLLSWGLSALLAAMILTAGCKGPPKPLQFNNIIASDMQRLAVESRKFYEAIHPHTLKAGSLDAVQKSYAQIQKDLAAVKKEIDALGTPLDSPNAPALLAKVKEFLQVEQTIFDQCFTPIMQILQDNTRFPDPATKWNAIAPLLAQANEMEKPSYQALTAAQAEFCKHHNFEAK